MNKEIIDIKFDFNNDTKCDDPDRDSYKLYEYHKLLWMKELPCGKKLNLDIICNSGRLLLKNNLYDNFSSDRMFPHLVGTFNDRFNGWLTDVDIKELKYKVRTIGGHIIFPAHKRNGMTINQVRGYNKVKEIADRFDLTLECIRLFYKDKNIQSPLSEVLLRYEDFFYLFEDYYGYINFFLLQDFIEENGNVKFILPFDEFKRSPLPESIEEYRLYKNNIVNLINKRNERISRLNIQNDM
jgi:hypothetical protein